MSNQSADISREPLEGPRSLDLISVPVVTYLLLAWAFVACIAYASSHPVAVVSYERDIWHHLSVYRELIASPFHALNPHVETADPSRSYSPWTMGVAIVARVVGWDAYGALSISAVLSAIVICLGVYLFSSEYWRKPLAPTVMLVVLFGTWLSSINHTGYHNISTSAYSLAYPYAIALGAGFVAWWLVLRGLKAERNVALFGIGLLVLSAFMFITHQLQGLFAVCGAVSFALFHGKVPAQRRLVLVGSLLLGLLATRYWWYFDPIGFAANPEVRRGHTAVRFLNYSLENYSEILKPVGLAVFGVLGMIDYQTRRLRLDIALPTLVILAGFLFIVTKGNWVSVRVLPFLILFLQIGLVNYLINSDPAGHGGRAGLVLRTVLAVAIGLGLIINVSIGNSAYTRARTYLDTGEIAKLPGTWSRAMKQDAAFVESLAPPESTVIAHLQTAFPIEATALNVVAIPRLFVEVPDMLERQGAVVTFFSAGANIRERCDILKEYKVKLIAYRDIWLDETIRSDLAKLGRVETHGELSVVVPKAEGFVGCGPT